MPMNYFEKLRNFCQIINKLFFKKNKTKLIIFQNTQINFRYQTNVYGKFSMIK